MLKEIILPITEQIHNLGHNSSSVDAMMDSVSGSGHRIKEGHDIQGLIEAFHLEGVEGIGLWFDHMWKDFTSPDGIPLPFAEAIYEVTGMEMDEAIDWLTINASDILELGVQQGVLSIFKNNKKAYHTSLLIGSIIGFLDDNPAIIVMNTVHYFNLAKKNEKLLPLLNPAIRGLNKTTSIISTVCIGTFTVNTGLALIGINLSDTIEGAGEISDGVDAAIETATVLSDVIDGASTLGLGILASKGVKQIAKSTNEKHLRKFEENQKNLSLYQSLSKQLTTGHPVSGTTTLLQYMQEKNLYPKQYLLGEKS